MCFRDTDATWEDRLRIIAGSARGRSFDAPPGNNTRPTLDRVKESLFGSIQFDIPDSTVLDLFSGSGNLGLEAASRGAKRVICNDHDRACAELIAKNAKKLNLDSNVYVTCKDYVACLTDLKRAGEQFDFVFLDPPYQEGAAKVAIEAIFSLGLLAEQGRVFLEHAEKLPPMIETPMAKMKQTKRYGTCAISVYEKNDEAKPE